MQNKCHYKAGAQTQTINTLQMHSTKQTPVAHRALHLLLYCPSNKNRKKVKRTSDRRKRKQSITFQQRQARLGKKRKHKLNTPTTISTAGGKTKKRQDENICLKETKTEHNTPTTASTAGTKTKTDRCIYIYIYMVGWAGYLIPRRRDY